jgi:hypothetical protein
MCFSKGSATHSLETDLNNTETAFLDNLSLREASTAWMAHIKLQGKQTPFKLDTGAEVTARHTRPLEANTSTVPTKLFMGHPDNP